MPTMTAGMRKFALTAHVTSSVGWLGAVAGFLALAIAGLTSPDARMVRAAYLAMELTTWFVIVPLSIASPLTGIIQSLGTTWGLFRHYWIVAKLVITIPASLVLLLHLRPIGHMARAVEATTLAHGELSAMRLQLVVNAGAAVVVLLVATALSVYKPRGRTSYGLRFATSSDEALERAPWVKAFKIIIAIFLTVLIAKHFASGGFGNHGRP